MKSLHESIFKDLTVIELASVLAGPSAGRFFAECGARVVKIEPVETGDVTRSWKLKGETGQISAYYASVNAGKEIIYLDLKSAHGLAVLESLLKQADIVLMNFKASSAIKMNLLPEQLRARFPKLIIAQLDAFRQGDNRPAYDIVLQAEAGYLSMCGNEHGATRLPVAFIDVLAGHQMKEGILLALLRRVNTFQGSIVRVNLLESAIGALMNQASNYLMQNHVASRLGTLHPNIAPYGECFVCKDGKELVLAIGNDKQFRLLLEKLNLNHINNSEDYTNNPKRVKNRDLLFEELSPVFKLHNRAYFEQLFEASGIPYGSILTLDEVLDGEGKSLIHEEFIEGELSRSLKTVNLSIND